MLPSFYHCSLSQSSHNLLNLFQLFLGDPESNIYWDIQLDADLLQTLVDIYPEWFQDYNLETMAQDGTDSSMIESDKSCDSSIEPEVDDASIKMAMDKNKESLKLKLMLRRPIQQLVEQGIIPRKCCSHFISLKIYSTTSNP